jgi:hypothetical protein
VTVATVGAEYRERYVREILDQIDLDAFVATAAEERSLRPSNRDITEVTMKGASKPKHGTKKQAQKSLKEKRQEKRAAAKKGFGAS